MKLTNIPSCCAAYAITHLDYFNPENDWFQEELKKDPCRFNLDKPNWGCQMMTMEKDRSGNRFEILLRQSRSSKAEFVEKMMNKLYNGGRIVSDNTDFDDSFIIKGIPNKTPPGGKNVHIGESYFIPKPPSNMLSVLRNGSVRFDVRKESNYEPPEDYVDAIIQELQDTAGCYIRDGYILIAITNDTRQRCAVVALDRLGFNRVKTVTSRNDTKLSTWYLNGYGIDSADKNEIWGEHRMMRTWMPRYRRKMDEYYVMLNDWEHAIEMNRNPERYDEDGYRTNRLTRGSIRSFEIDPEEDDWLPEDDG